MEYIELDYGIDEKLIINKQHIVCIQANTESGRTVITLSNGKGYTVPYEYQDLLNLLK